MQYVRAWLVYSSSTKYQFSSHQNCQEGALLAAPLHHQQLQIEGVLWTKILHCIYSSKSTYLSSSLCLLSTLGDSLEDWIAHQVPPAWVSSPQHGDLIFHVARQHACPVLSKTHSALWKEINKYIMSYNIQVNQLDERQGRWCTTIFPSSSLDSQLMYSIDSLSHQECSAPRTHFLRLSKSWN